MRVLMSTKGGLGQYYIEFKPIADDWLSWKTAEGELKIIHEKCWHVIAIDHNKKELGYLAGEGICARCGREAPSTVRQFILLANGVRDYEMGRLERD